MRVCDALQFGSLPLLEREILLASLLQVDRTWLLAHPETPLSDEVDARYQSFVFRRMQHEPIAYITGIKEFYGRTFHVTPDVLIPRPATESMVDAVRGILQDGVQKGMRTVDNDIVLWSARWQREKSISSIVDVGTGSGCIAITLALEFPEYQLVGTDISLPALTIAQENAKNHPSLKEIIWMAGDGIQALKNWKQNFLLVSNPPYIRASAILETDVMDYEPHAALYAGEDGMEVLTPLVRDAILHPYCIGCIVECTGEQASILSSLLDTLTPL